MYEARIVALYAKHNPKKGPKEVAGLLDRTKGGERELYERICKKYKVAPLAPYREKTVLLEPGSDGKYTQENTQQATAGPPPWLQTALTPIPSPVVPQMFDKIAAMPRSHQHSAIKNLVETIRSRSDLSAVPPLRSPSTHSHLLSQAFADKALAGDLSQFEQFRLMKKSHPDQFQQAMCLFQYFQPAAPSSRHAPCALTLWRPG